MAWTKPGPGRPKGSINKRREEALGFVHELLTDPEYRKNLIVRARAGILAPALEQLFWHYEAGKPRETVAIVDERESLRDVSTDELRGRLDELRKQVDTLSMAHAVATAVAQGHTPTSANEDTPVKDAVH